jgi:hypothetical protein
LNGLVHGFAAALKPPEDAQERELYEGLLTDLAEEFLPCGRAEALVLEEIVVLELRRIKIQEAQMGELALDEQGLKRTLLISRYETETLNKLEKKRKLLNELQTTRAQRRGLALESALVQRQVETMKQQLGEDAGAIARRSLGRELHDLMDLAPEAADEAAAALLGSPTPFGVPTPRQRAAGGTGGGFRPFAAPGPALPSSPFGGDADPFGDRRDACPTRDREEGSDEPGAVPALIPGPVWDPWRGASPEQLEAWNDELIERRKAQLRAELEELEQAQGPPEELVRMFPEHYNGEGGNGDGDGDAKA